MSASSSSIVDRLGTHSQGSRRLRLLSLLALAAICLLAWAAAPARAATVALYAAPLAAGSGNCSSPANACTITSAIAAANGASAADSVLVKLAGGVYALSEPAPTALEVTFAGPRLSLEAAGGRPVLSGTDNVRILSVGAASTVTVDGLEFESAAATGFGGAIQSDGELTVRNSTFTRNTAPNGGAIQTGSGATLTVEDSTFAANTATGVGGGAIMAMGSVTILRSTFSGNSARINGGAINVQSGAEVLVSSSTFAGNSSGGMGGATSSLGMLTIQSSTLVNNSASAGAAVATGGTGATFAATIIGPQTSGAACTAGSTDAGYNLDVDGTCISADAPAPGSHNGTTAYGSSTYGAALSAYLADGLAPNGGPTQTVALRESPNPPTSLANPAFAVVPASFLLPAAIGGTAAACALPDQRGVARPAPCGIGAVELIPPTPTPPIAKASRFGIKKIVHVRSKGMAKLQIRFTGPGSIQLAGKRIEPVSRRTQAGLTFLPVRPSPALASLLRKRGRVHVTVRVSFTPDAGNNRTKDKKIGLWLLSRPPHAPLPRQPPTDPR